MPPFLCSQLDAPVVSKAFLNHDLATLKLHCAPELVERFSGIFRHFSEQVRAVGSTALLLGHGLPWQLRMGVACEVGLDVTLCCCSFNDAEALDAGGGASCFIMLQHALLAWAAPEPRVEKLALCFFGCTFQRRLA